MYVVDSSFSFVKGRALSSSINLVTTTDIFHHFFSHIYKQWQIFLPTTTSVKISKNNTKFRKIKTKIWKDICISSVLKKGSSADSFKEAYLNY